MTSNTGGYYPPQGNQPSGGPGGLPPGFPGYPGYPPTAPKRKSPWPWIIGIAAAAVVAIVIGAIAIVVVTSWSDDAATTKETVVTYEVTGTAGSVELAYWGPTGGNRPETVTLPWRKEVTVSGEDAYVSVSAKTTDGSFQEWGCRIMAKGKTVVEDQKYGGTVGCMGRLNQG